MFFFNIKLVENITRENKKHRDSTPSTTRGMRNTKTENDIERLAQQLEQVAITLRQLENNNAASTEQRTERRERTVTEQRRGPRRGNDEPPTITRREHNIAQIPDYNTGERVYYSAQRRSKRGKGLEHPLNVNPTGTVVRQTKQYIEIDPDNLVDAGTSIVRRARKNVFRIGWDDVWERVNR